MSENYKQRSILEIMNDVLGTIRDYYDSEYVYYIERDEEEILTIYEWCAEFVPWQRDKIKMLDKEQWKINGFSTFLTRFAFSTHSTTWEASSVSLNTQEMIFLEYRSITLVRYTNPSNVQI